MVAAKCGGGGDRSVNEAIVAKNGGGGNGGYDVEVRWRWLR